MAGMEYDFTANVAPFVAALEAAIGAAKRFESAVEGARNAEMELGASGIEAAAGLTAQAAAMDAAAASASSLRDTQGRFLSSVAAVRRETERVAGSLHGQSETGGEAAGAMRELEAGSRRMGLTAAEAGNAAALAMGDFERKIGDARRIADEASRGIDDMQKATSKSEVAAIGAAHGLRDMERGGRVAGDALGDLEKAAGDAADAGGGLSKLTGVLGPAALPAGIAALVVGAAASAPALVSAGLGFGAFGALAAPALYKVKTGLSEVAWAQRQYTLAKGVEARNPTKGNLAAEQRDLAALRTTWASMPAPVAAAVRSVRSFGQTWSRIGQRSGIQKAALGDLQQVMKIGKDFAPSVASLAKAAAPAISGLLHSMDRGIKSGGFRHFIHDMGSEIGPATRSLTRLGGAGLGFIGHTLQTLKPVSAPFLNSLTKLTHAITPGFGSVLKNAATGLTGIISATAGAAPGIQSVAKSMGQIASAEAKMVTKDSGLGQFAPSNVSAAIKDAQSRLHSTAQQLHIGGGAGAALGTAFRRAFGSFIPGLSELNTGNAIHKLMGGTAGKPVTVPVKPVLSGTGDIGAALRLHKAVPIAIKPVITGTGLAGALQSAQKALGSAVHSAQQAVHIKPKIDSGDVRKQIEGAAKSGGNIPVKGRVTLTGLSAGIKSQIASLKIPDSKVHIAIQVTGAGPARAAMASVVAAARKAAAGAAAALGGLGAAGAAAGAALDAGLAGAISAGAGAVVAAAAAVAGAAAAAVRRASGISSPSKVWHGIGKNMIAGLIAGLQGGKAEVQAAARAITGAAAPFKDASITATVKKLREDVRKAFRSGDIGKRQRDGLIDYIDSGNRKLMHLAQQRAKIMGEIKAATALAKSVTQAAVASADITGIAGTVLADKNKGQGGMTIQEGQQQQLGKIRQFTHAIRQLKKEGLDKTSIRQLLAAGVSGGLPAAQQLLSEGPKAVRESARLQKEILKASKGLGVTGANAAYESASQMGKGLAAGLRAQLKPIVTAMRDIARALIATLRHELGLKPGQGLGGLLDGLGGGGGHGGHGGGGHKHGKGGGLGKIHELPGGPGGLIRPGPGLGQQMHPGMRAAPVHVVVHNHVVVQVGGQQVGAVVQQIQLRHARRNIATGLKLANRAA